MARVSNNLQICFKTMTIVDHDHMPKETIFLLKLLILQIPKKSNSEDLPDVCTMEANNFVENPFLRLFLTKRTCSP